MTKQFNLGCFHESSSTQKHFDTKTSKTFKSKNFNNNTLSIKENNENAIIQNSKSLLERKKFEIGQGLKKKRLYASSDNLNCNEAKNKLGTGTLSNTNSAKSLSLTTNNFIFNNQLTKQLASLNTYTNASYSSLSSISFHSLLSDKINDMSGLRFKKGNISNDVSNFSPKTGSSKTSIETKEPIQVYSALLNNRSNDDGSKNYLEKLESNNNSLSTGSNDIGQAEVTSNEINSLFSCSDKDENFKLKDPNIDSGPRLSDLLHSSSVTCSTSSLATSYTSNLFDTSLITTSNILKTSSSESIFGQNKPFDCFLSNSSLSSSTSSVTNISNCSNLTLTETKKNVNEKKGSFLKKIESSFFYDRRKSSISNLVKGCSKNIKKNLSDKQTNNWEVKEKTITRPQIRPSSTQPISPKSNEENLKSYNQILDNIKNINKKIIENNEEIMSIENLTNAGYFSATSSSTSSSSRGSFQASPTSIGSTSSFSSISEITTNKLELNKGKNTNSLLRKETRSVALCYYHHLFNEKQKIDKHVCVKKKTQPLYKLTYNDINVKCETRLQDLLKRKPVQDLNFEIYKSKKEMWMDLNEINQNTNKIFRQETTKKMQLQAPANLKRF